MEPSHKDAETAAAAAAVAAAERGASSSSGVVVQVREKKGPLRAAIPYMPFPVAVICLFLNTFVPGLGTFVSAFTVLCGARTDLPDRHVCCVFWLNIAAALIQILTAIVMVGWIMSIFWGMDMVILASRSSSLTRSTSSQALCPSHHTPHLTRPFAGGVPVPEVTLDTRPHRVWILEIASRTPLHHLLEEDTETREGQMGTYCFLTFHHPSC
ncbi:protein stum homolog isoform X1 [Bubalus bubalis]|uniref:protein stum homolog isoform X1 n=1 Tax=Bubalus bubalis TaxID=89462 RepID=UPI00042D04B1|nr:protein stum homolog isoform X1 [Bubalus bubalis]